MSENFYQILGVASNATPNEIQAAFDTRYNEVRRLVNHSDPQVVNRANQDIHSLTTAREVLINPQKKAEYDATLGLGTTGGLEDPSETLRKINSVMLSPFGPTVNPNTQHTASVQSVGRVDAWVCNNCHLPNPIATRFCKKCGKPVGINCPKCSQIIEVAAQHCQHCGVDVKKHTRILAEEKARAKEEAHLKEIAAQENKRQENERFASLGLIANKADSAWNKTKFGCIATIFLPIAAPFLWIGGLLDAKKALSYIQVAGDEGPREKANKAYKYSVISLSIWAIITIGLFLIVIGGILAN